MRKIGILQSGCFTHDQEYRSLLENLKGKYELVHNPIEADVLIQYFCAVAQVRIRNIARELLYVERVKAKNAILIVCGCGVDAIGKDFFLEFDFVDAAIGKENLAKNILAILNEQEVSKQFFLQDNPDCFDIDICGGCVRKGGYCSFCKQNYMKVPVKSRPMEEILQIATDVTTSKPGTIIGLQALNICNYGIDMEDKKPKLHLLIQKLAEIPTVRRIELRNVTAGDVYEELAYEIETNPKVGQVYLAVQSGSNRMLQIMNVHSDVKMLQTLLNRFSYKVQQSIVVINHPGETEETLQETIDFIVKNNFWFVTVSNLQRTIGTPSYQMKQADISVQLANYQKVSKVVEELRSNFLHDLVDKEISAYYDSYEIEKNKEYVDIFYFAKEFNGRLQERIWYESFEKHWKGIECLVRGDQARVKVLKVIDEASVLLQVMGIEVIAECGM